MSDRLNPQPNTNTNLPAPKPKSAQSHATATPSESQNVPQCPVIQKFALPQTIYITPAQNELQTGQSAPPPIPTDIPDYTPSQQDADPDSPPLSPQQQQAIYLLLQGLSDTAVAKRLGLNRKTLYRWKWHTPIFYNTLDEAQREAWNEAYGLLRSSILQSAPKLNQIIKKGAPQDAIRAAKVLLSTPVLKRLEG